MRERAVAAALVAVASLGADAAAAPRRTERTERFPYVLPMGLRSAGGYGASCGDPDGFPERACPKIELRPTEKYLKFWAVDESGAEVGIQHYASGGYAEVQFVCGKGTATYRVSKHVELRVAIDVEAPCSGVPTRGVLTVLISNLPYGTG